MGVNAHPAGCQDRGVIDAQLSRAIVISVWGTHGRPWPSRDTEAVGEEYGDDALDLIPRINGIFELVDKAPVDWSTEDLPAATERVESLVRAAHPELDEAAIRAIGLQFSYNWK